MVSPVLVMRERSPATFVWVLFWDLTRVYLFENKICDSVMIFDVFVIPPELTQWLRNSFFFFFFFLFLIDFLLWSVILKISVLFDLVTPGATGGAVPCYVFAKTSGTIFI